MKKIQLNKGYFALVDDRDYEQLNKYKWAAHVDKYTVYAVRSEYLGNYKKQRIIMHRAIMNHPDNLDVDHIDHNGLNNQRSNLRIATRSQNACNGNGKKGWVPYKGVCFVMGEVKKYVAQIQYQGKKYHIGVFGSAVCAALAYDKKAKELHGEFAQLNFPDSWFES